MKNYKAIEENGEDAMKIFREDFYIQSDIEYWLYKIHKINSDYNRYKSGKYKSRATVDIYSVYIQLIEIFFINLNATSTSDEGFLPALFINNFQIKSEIEKIKDGKSERLNIFLDKNINPIEKFFAAGDPIILSNQMRLYRSTFVEVINDYLNDFQFLNAFKHGFRVKFNSSDRKYTISLGEGRTFPLLETTATISYYSSSRNKEGQKIIYDHDLSFHPDRIFGKSIFVYAMLHNLFEIRKSIGEQKPGKYRQFSVGDRKLWNSYYPSFRNKMNFGEII